VAAQLRARDADAGKGRKKRILIVDDSETTVMLLETELRDKGLVDFYETRPREVVLYWRDMAPSAKKDVELKLLATTPGTYEGPASSAYLYYTAEDKSWAKPVGLTIE